MRYRHHAKASYWTGASLLLLLAAGSSCQQFDGLTAQAPLAPQAERVPVEATLRTHAPDGLPEGHPEIREFVEPLEDYYSQRLAARQVDYGHALRIASLKLRGNVPSLPEIRELQDATDPAQTYRELIDRMLRGKVKNAQGAEVDDPRFAFQVRAFWRNTLHMGAPGQPGFGIVDQDAPANMAAMITVTDLPYTEMFTRPSDQCWTMAANGTFTQSTCMCSSGLTAAGASTGSMACFNGNTPNAGIVGNPAFQAVNYGGLAFRRVREVQEIFACRPMPAEPQGVWDTFAQYGQAMPANPVDFASAESVVCAKCHQTMNRQAPMFANYDKAGVLRDRANLKSGGKTCATSSPYSCNFEVESPTSPARPTVISDYLTAPYVSPTVQLGWRVGAQVQDLNGFGQAMANDAEVARCLVNRLWYWVMSRGNITTDPVRPPQAMTDAWIEVLNSTTNPYDGSPRTRHSLKAVLYTMLTSDDFIRF